MRPKALLSTVMLGAACSSYAQTNVPPSAETPVAASALRRIDLETHTAVRVITRQELSSFHHLGLGQMLRRLPFMAGSAPNLNSNAAGDGGTLADIGSFGRSRSIVMLNGYRLPVDELLGEPAVDLDSLPLAAVDRIEIFLGGASVLWGADAVSGVINVITRAETDGLELTVSTTDSAHHDGQSNRASVFGGWVSGRGYANVAMEYRDSEPIHSTARGFSARDETLGCLDGPDCVWPFGNSITPAGVFSIPEYNTLGLAAGRYTPDAKGDYRLFEAAGPQNDLYSTQGETFLRAGRNGASVLANGGYEISDATQLKFDVLASTDRSRRQLSSLPLSTALAGALTEIRDINFTYILLPPTVFDTNYYNPFGVFISDARRRLVELGPRSFTNGTENVFLAGSARHITGAWGIDSSISLGRLEATERISHVVRPDRLMAAVGPSAPDENGVIRCGFPDPETGLVTEPLPDCVPLDLFHGPGTITKPMLDYVTESREDETRVTQTQGRLVARRELAFGAQRQPARMALGIESRRLEAKFDFPTYDMLPTSHGGSVQQHDLMTELAWPLGDVSGGAQSAVITTGGRASWFENRSLIGSAFAAALWRPSTQYLLRGRVTQIHRSPSAGEMYLGRRERVLPVSSPCNGPIGQDSILCQKVGSPVGVPSIAGDAPYLTAGNPDLRPERGYGASAGAVWNEASTFVALDFTWVQLHDAIRTPGAIEVLEACRDTESSDSCSRIIPVDGSDTFAIDGRPMNGGRDESARLDLEARTAGSTKWGDWRAESFASYLVTRELVDISGDTMKLRGIFDVTQSTTGAAFPALRWQGKLQWLRAPWSARWMMQYVGPVDEIRDRNGFLRESGGALRRVGSTVYHDFSLSWTERSPWSFQVDVENVFDRAPPRVNNGFEANTDSPSYRLEGRLYSLTVKFSS